MIYLQLLWVYLKIGMFGFGGGYAMLSLIQHEIVDIHHWLTPQQFTDVVAISQMTPGPIGINSATLPFLGAGGGKFLPANRFLLYKTGCHCCFQESVYCYSLC